MKPKKEQRFKNGESVVAAVFTTTTAYTWRAPRWWVDGYVPQHLGLLRLFLSWSLGLNDRDFYVFETVSVTYFFMFRSCTFCNLWNVEKYAALHEILHILKFRIRILFIFCCCGDIKLKFNWICSITFECLFPLKCNHWKHYAHCFYVYNQ